MGKAFRRLGSDRNSVAINKAVADPQSPVPRPTVGDITGGQVVVVTTDTNLGSRRVGPRKTGAVLINQPNATDSLKWYIANDTLTVEANGTDGDYTFWVF